MLKRAISKKIGSSNVSAIFRGEPHIDFCTHIDSHINYRLYRNVIMAPLIICPLLFASFPDFRQNR